MSEAFRSARDPRNVRLAEVLWYAHYIEKVGTGTLDVIAGCQRADLPEPDFRQSGDEFLLTIWRDWITEEVLAGLDLNDRQRKGLDWIKRHGRITNREYQELTGAIDRTALRDLGALLQRGLVEKVGVTGRSAYYAFAQTRLKPDKPDISVPAQTRHKPDKPDIGTSSRTRQKPVHKRVRPEETRRPLAKRATVPTKTRNPVEPATKKAGKARTRGSKHPLAPKKPKRGPH